MHCRRLGPTGRIYNVAFLFGLFGFLRQSKLAPANASTFDCTRHTCRGDVLVRPPGLVIILKWSKSCQRREEPSTVALPKIPAHPLCPLQAYREMLAISPTHHPNQPLLMIPGACTHRPSLTTGQRTRTLQDLIYSASQNRLHRSNATAHGAQSVSGVT